MVSPPRVVVYASEPQYVAHLTNTARHLPDPILVAHRDVAAIVATDPLWGGARVVDSPAELPELARNVWLVAAPKDAHATEPLGCPVAAQCHGAGHTWRNPRFLTRGDRRTRLVLTPNELSVAPLQRHNPQARVVAVGSPQLDTLPTAPPAGDRPVVVLAWHWDCHTVPETRTALPHYEAAVRALAARQDDLPYRLVGHGHPRAWAQLEDLYRECGIEPVRSYDDALAVGHLLVCDNSSIMYSWAATGRPVLTLNAPWYRRNINQGLRCWDGIPGLQCDEPDDLPDQIVAALTDPYEAQVLRADAVRLAYGTLDGRAGERAAAAVMALAEELDPSPVALAGRLGTVTVSRHAWDLLTTGVEVVLGRRRMVVARDQYEQELAGLGWREVVTR